MEENKGYIFFAKRIYVKDAGGKKGKRKGTAIERMILGIRKQLWEKEVRKEKEGIIVGRMKYGELL